MNKNTCIVFFVSSLRSPRNIYWLILAAFFFIIGLLDFITDYKVVGSMQISFFLMLFLPAYLFAMLNSRIRIELGFVEKSTFLRRTKIQFKDIKSYGVYTQEGKAMPKIVSPSDVDENSLFAINQVFITTAKNFDPAFQNIGDTITFQFRNEMYEVITKTLPPLDVASRYDC